MNILYFPRKYNDTDNIVPILYLLLENYPSLNLYIYNLRDDHNIFYDANINLLVTVFPQRIKLCSNEIPLFKRISSTMKGIKTSLSETNKILNFRTELFTDLLSRCDFRLAVFDHTKDKKSMEIAGILKARCVPVISLPHGIRVTLNQLRTKNDYCLDDKRRRLLKNIKSMEVFDQVYYTDDLYLNEMIEFCDKLNVGRDPLNRIKTIGSLRYSEYWIKKKEQFERPFQWNTGKRKVLLLPTKPEKNTHWDEFILSLKMMGQAKNISYIIKPFHGLKDAIPKNIANVEVIDRFSSSSLIQSADIVMFWATSVVFEALTRAKPCIYMPYLHSNRTMFDIYDAAWNIETCDDLYDCINTLDDLSFDAATIVNGSARSELLRRVVFNGLGSLQEHLNEHIRLLGKYL